MLACYKPAVNIGLAASLHSNILTITYITTVQIAKNVIQTTSLTWCGASVSSAIMHNDHTSLLNHRETQTFQKSCKNAIFIDFTSRLHINGNRQNP